MRRLPVLLKLALQLRAVYEIHAKRQLAEECRRRSDVCSRARMLHEGARQIDKALDQGWRLAANRLKGPFEAQARQLVESLNDAQSLKDDSWQTRSVEHFLAELAQLHEEFEPVSIELRSGVLAITTDRIVLEETDLGPFAIRLNYRLLKTRTDCGCFRIVALDATSAAGNDSVTHPHVRDESLCAGDATLPIAQALAQGRLVDAFCLVRSVLATYNDESAYVRLDDWHGIDCWECGRTTDSDDRSTCEDCDHEVCLHCMWNCRACGNSACSSCMPRCDACQVSFCSDCLHKSASSETYCCQSCMRYCEGCERDVAVSDFDAKADRCHDCRHTALTDSTPLSSSASPDPD